jgi:hypothetical protein
MKCSPEECEQLAQELLATLRRVRAVLELGVRVGDIREVLWATQDESLWDYIDVALARGQALLQPALPLVELDVLRNEGSCP